jgi:sortase A
MPFSDRRFVRTSGGALIAVGLLCLAWVAVEVLTAATFRATHRARVEADLPAASAAATPASVPPGDDSGVGSDGIIGVLEIPRLGVSEVVAAGDSDATLKVAIGHLSDTPLPWADGNAVLAAHRDTHFRPLRHVQYDDVIRLKTRRGVFDYRVRDRLIVDPDDVWVIAPSKTRRLTLVTCYPFNYVGSAPQRFVVLADAR